MRNDFPHPRNIPTDAARQNILPPGPQQKWMRRAKRGEGPSRTLSRGENSLLGDDHLSSAMEWRGIEDKPAKEREARLLTKEEQLLYSGCVKALPLAYSEPILKDWGWQGALHSLPVKIPFVILLLWLCIL